MIETVGRTNITRIFRNSRYEFYFSRRADHWWMRKDSDQLPFWRNITKLMLYSETDSDSCWDTVSLFLNWHRFKKPNRTGCGSRIRFYFDRLCIF